MDRRDTDGDTDPRQYFRRMLTRRDAEERALLSRAKRFRERYIADDRFRAALDCERDHPDEVTRRFNVPIAASAVRPLWDARAAGCADAYPAAAAVEAWYDDHAALRGLMAGAASTGGVNPRFDAWHARQVRRSRSELGADATAITHPVVAFELSVGCRVGCWFCAVAAQPFRSHWPRTPANRALWRDVLAGLGGLLGPAVGTGVCYWATEPLDNPDFAGFLEDYLAETGWLPQTTTAAPLRDPALTRRVLDLCAAHPGLVNRFSLLTLRDLDRVHAAFSPEEMLGVELVLQNRGSLSPKTAAGRALEQRRRGHKASERWSEGTSACVSGFLVNMPEGRVRLVTPCLPGPEAPLGYRCLAEQRFSTAAGFLSACGAMIDAAMPESLPSERTVSFRADLAYQPRGDGFRVANGRVSHDVNGWTFLRPMGELIRAGSSSPGDIVTTLVRGGADVFLVVGALQQLYEIGLVVGAPPAAGPGDTNPIEGVV